MSNQRICSVEGCGKRHLARGRCRKHYQHLVGSRECAIEGCEKPVNTAGMCVSHWRRLRRFGDPKAQYPERKREAQRFLEEVVLPFKGSECLIWPHAINKVTGYGSVLYKKKTYPLQRIICTLVHGQPPSAKHQAAHLCGNRICCNPDHLAWCTVVENHAHRVAHGTAFQGPTHPRRKLEEHQVRKIFSMRGERDAASLALEYGVKPTTIKKIMDGTAWACLSLLKNSKL